MAKREKPLHSLFAGATAGTIEAYVKMLCLEYHQRTKNLYSAVTYPTEFVKTRSQFGGQVRLHLLMLKKCLTSLCDSESRRFRSSGTRSARKA
jgi:solute carrier family 25 citrate transporter 1